VSDSPRLAALIPLHDAQHVRAIVSAGRGGDSDLKPEGLTRQAPAELCWDQEVAAPS